jgi:D-alanyl-D-alanine carboxypeptidase
MPKLAPGSIVPTQHPGARHTFVRALLALAVLACAPAPPALPSTRPASVSPAPVSGSPFVDPNVMVPNGNDPRPTADVVPATPTDGGSAPASLTNGATFDGGTAAALEAVIEKRRRALRIPGMTVSLRLADGTTWNTASGLAVTDPATPAEPGTPFAIASITKTFVAALILQLAEEGALSLDDALSRYMPDYQNASRITIRHLLNHTSGIHNYFEHPRYDRLVFRDRKRVWTVDEILGLVRKPYFAPGRTIHYSNTNYVLLGVVAERVTGSSLGKEIRRRFVEPLGLQDTAFQYEEHTPGDAAHGYLLYSGGVLDQTDGSRRVPNTSAVTVAWAAGAMVSSAPDLATWASALYGGRVVSPESVALMVDFGTVDDYGLGTRKHVFTGRTAVGHTGGIRGFSTAMWHLPAEGVTIVVLTNRGFVDPNRLTRDILRVLFRELGVPSPSPSPTPTPVPSP